VLDIPVDRPKVLETTALGAAYLAGLQAGLYNSLEAVQANWQRDKHFEPQMEYSYRETLLKGWNIAVKKVLT
jgi:glycerol kinase